MRKQLIFRYIIFKFGKWHYEWFGIGLGWNAPMKQDLSILKINLLFFFLITKDNGKFKDMFKNWIVKPISIVEIDFNELISKSNFIDYSKVHFDKLIPGFIENNFDYKYDFELDQQTMDDIDELFKRLMDENISIVSRSPYYLIDLLSEWAVFNKYYDGLPPTHKHITYDDIHKFEKGQYTF